MAGFDGWIEIFRGGAQTDSNGATHDGDRLIDQAVATFAAAEHEPPAVIGHPVDNAPAYGWVYAVRQAVRDGAKILEAKIRDTAPGFVEAVKNGAFKNRSAAFYPNGRLRHVGFLGAVPPAVKGLADIAFTGGDSALVFEFSEIPLKSREVKSMKFSEWWAKIWAEKPRDLEMDLPGAPQPGGGQFSEDAARALADRAAEEAKKAAEVETRKKVEAEFAEKSRVERAKNRKIEIAQYIENGIKSGKIAPAWRDAGMATFMEGLDAAAAIQFAEGEKGKKTGSAWFMDFLEALPKVIRFEEIAKRGGDPGAGFGSAAKRFDSAARERMKADNIAFGEAQVRVARDNPDLYKEMEQEMRS